ncbi:hypothetical protein [Burkholderia ubonensis]|uniref:hypothetical protein n=1 Tax=Burkholderia ubonensis TaxID=101571 RepID=UPI0007545B98|nr:hypothetical protein [Burkholderia ubonensis]KVP79992.1 hypothetical protein WJ93_29990 [Burkholderia ubonensis]KWC60241.1 hypothetical protein WL53_12805 [Burkholderia ubonensis]
MFWSTDVNLPSAIGDPLRPLLVYRDTTQVPNFVSRLRFLNWLDAGGLAIAADPAIAFSSTCSAAGIEPLSVFTTR